jgi:hypothetical protein
MLTTAESLLIDLICAASIKRADAIAYLQSLPRPWCNKRSRACWPVVLHTTSLANHLAGLLKDLAYERRAQPVVDIVAMCAADVANRPPPTTCAPGNDPAGNDSRDSLDYPDTT